MSRSILPFDPLTVPVQGTALIEASAGTGKTYGIAALFARLILLEKLPVDKVLVVTFTKAATAELKTRLRGRLDEAFRCRSSTTPPSTPSTASANACWATTPSSAKCRLKPPLPTTTTSAS